MTDKLSLSYNLKETFLCFANYGFLTGLSEEIGKLSIFYIEPLNTI